MLGFLPPESDKNGESEGFFYALSVSVASQVCVSLGKLWSMSKVTQSGHTVEIIGLQVVVNPYTKVTKHSRSKQWYQWHVPAHLLL